VHEVRKMRELRREIQVERMYDRWLKASMTNNFIGVYENVLSHSACDELIDFFDFLNHP
jgi:hypothetical protein